MLKERKCFLLLEENNVIFKKLIYHDKWQKTLRTVVCEDSHRSKE